MTHEEEEELRALAILSTDAAQVLADYYEQGGQPTRAQMWRRAMGLLPGEPSGCSLGVPDLCVDQPPTTKQDPRRNMMIWVLHHVASRRALAKHFGVSLTRVVQIIADVERRAMVHAWHEANAPTMAATVRLRAAGAIDLRRAELGEPPPDDWPRPHRARGPRVDSE